MRVFIGILDDSDCTAESVEVDAKGLKKQEAFNLVMGRLLEWMGDDCEDCVELAEIAILELAAWVYHEGEYRHNVDGTDYIITTKEGSIL